VWPVASNPPQPTGYQHIPNPFPLPLLPRAQGGWQLTQEVYDRAASLPSATVLSWERPRLVLFRSFLSPPEVEYLLSISRDHLVRSEVLSAESNGEVDKARTSFGFWPSNQDPEVIKIDERLHRLAGIPREFGEDIYVLNYKHGQHYDP
jgi:hypothetical protein